MSAYIIRRLLLIVPTMFGIMVLNFFIVQLAPGGPIEQTIARWQFGGHSGALERVSGSESDFSNGSSSNASSSDKISYSGSQGVSPELIEELKKQYGFDKPLWQRFWQSMANYLVFDFGDSFYRDISVIDLILEKIPVSLSLGLWSTLFIYLLSIPLGIRKAVADGTVFDRWSSAVIIVAYSVPGFLLAILLVVLFAGGSYWQWFPLRGLVSSNFEQLSWWRQILDYFWHITLPVFCLSVGSIATLALLTKNSFLEEVGKQYVITARSKGLTERRILYGHVFRNAMLIIIAGMPATLIGVFLAGSLLIEIIFSLDGLGLLGYESIVKRDYPVIFANIYLFTLIGLLLKLVSDVTYTLIDPRIDFETR